MRCVICKVIFALILATLFTIFIIWQVGIQAAIYDISSIQTFTLAFFVILLACRIHNFFKGAAKVRIFWMHLFNFFLFLIQSATGFP